MITSKQLCLNLLKADTEEEVIAILKSCGYWETSNVWRLFGDRENNFSTIGNQQSRPEAALTEKVVNAIDARLMCECMKHGVSPTANSAPGSIKDAVARFISGKTSGVSSCGSLQDWTNTQRREESKEITIALTGSKKRPCVTISDTGEGQSPQMMPNTFLSLDKSNKLRIPFVQGKFNMGGTGVLQFCGHSNLQLIVTHRNPEIVKAMAESDDTVDLWAFTIVRRETGTGGVKNSVYTYLAPVGADFSPRQGEVLRFSAVSLPLMPDGNNPFLREIFSGSTIKLYEYDMKGFSSHALMRDGLLSRLEAMLTEPALPIRIHECRDYRGHAGSFETTLVGLNVRLDDNRGDNIEDGFPDSIPFKVEGENMTARIYALKADRAETYRTNEGIIFSINGQTHGTIPKTIFSRNSVKMGRLADSLLVTIDCTEISVRAREDLFMNSRDRLRNSELRKALEDQLEDILKQHSGLRELREKRQREEIEKRLEQSRPLEEVLEKLLKASPSLSRLFQTGSRILKPFKTSLTKGTDGNYIEGQKGDKPFVGRPHPTYFKFPKKPYGEILQKYFELGRRCRISFETDVVNDYFQRIAYPGRFRVEVLSPTGIQEPNWSLTPHNGIASLSLVMPEDYVIGDKMTLQFTVIDDVINEPFVNVATLTATPRSERPSGNDKQRKGTGSGGDSHGPSGMALPNIIEVEEKEWDKYKFDRFTACDIVQDADTENEDESIYTFRINVDNLYLQTEIKVGGEDPRLPRAKFVFGNVLIGLALIQHFNEIEKTRTGNDAIGEGNNQFKLSEELTIEVFVRETTRAIAPFILPMINQLGALSEDEVAALGGVGDDE
jgi:hypothetical protein